MSSRSLASSIGLPTAARRLGLISGGYSRSIAQRLMPMNCLMVSQARSTKRWCCPPETAPAPQTAKSEDADDDIEDEVMEDSVGRHSGSSRRWRAIPGARRRRCANYLATARKADEAGSRCCGCPTSPLRPFASATSGRCSIRGPMLASSRARLRRLPWAPPGWSCRCAIHR